MSAFLPGGGRMFTVQCSSCKRGQKGVFETGFHLTSKIFAAISLNIFFVCVSACVPECVCVLHTIAWLLLLLHCLLPTAEKTMKTQSRGKLRARRHASTSLWPHVLHTLRRLVSLPLTSSSITGCSSRCCCCCCCLFDCCFN